MNGPGSTAGQLQGLADRIRNVEEDLQKARRDADELRRDNAALEGKLEKRNKRITDLLEEKFGLADQLQRVQSGPSSAAPPGLDGHASDTIPDTIPEKRRPSGFTVISTDISNRDKNEWTRRASTFPNISEWHAGRRPSDIKPELLNEAAWVLTEVPEDDRTGYKTCWQERAGTEQEDADGSADGRADTPTSPTSAADDRRPLKRRRLDSGAHRLDNRRSSITFGRDPSGAEDEARGRSAHRRPSGRRRRQPSRQSRGRDPREFRRKAICVHCWTSSSYCDFSPKCATCVRFGVRCVRKLCEAGEKCWRPNCPCLHPGEWDEKDPEYTVEEGRMPKK